MLMRYTMLAATGYPEQEQLYRDIADILVTLALTARFHRRDKPNSALRQCARMMMSRITSAKAVQICQNVASPRVTPDPVAFVTHLLRNIEEADAEIYRRMVKDGVLNG